MTSSAYLPPTSWRVALSWVILCGVATGLLIIGHRQEWLWLPPLFTLLAVLFSSQIRVFISRLEPWQRFRGRLAPFIEAIPNAVVVVDSEGHIAALNARTEAWFGYAHDELLGKPIETLLPPDLRRNHVHLRQSFMQALAARPMGQGRELFACRKDGSEFPVEIGLNPLATSKGTMVLSSIIDITERKDNEARFHAQAAQVAQASRYKSEFLANMSHELRTPLNSILILSEQLCANSQNNLLPKQLNYAEIIHQSGQDLLALIEDILDLSRIEAGKLEIHEEPLAPKELRDYMRRAFTPVAEARQLTLSCEVSPQVPDVVIVDFKRLYQIVKNLFSNASKFTSAGGRVGILIDADINAEELRISVSDTGSGIPPSKQEEIFQAFVQLDGTASRRYSGSGLGLAIARQLASLLGGSLGVESTVDVGSTFTLYLPLVTKRPPSLPQRHLDDPHHPVQPHDPELLKLLAGRKVLLVDDEIRNIFAMTSLLEEAGLDVRVARNGQEALEAVKRQPEIELVMMDMMMPVMDGYQATASLRNDLQFRKPILALTALAMKGDREKCLAAGADDYMAKPVQRQALLHLLGKMLDEAGMSRSP
ncbi:hybrid sensor histidine kinase/response regulator [Paludibacterium purpuratum]|uniref:Virulence sensor protein BvgS n=1 Tax=Paludibacterium purpuratum TaxID=1144873 RepID=A0A4R7AYR5_9NEIS|nr:ATP-binding protein [Paludibacterium purpuratum]TDR73243.1 PAS domain S-box-containing protein [Paludibacterium purpuratum]